jgi:hypothetical protein
LALRAFDATPMVHANIANAAANIEAMSHWRSWTIAVSPPPLPTLEVGDASQLEGHDGSRTLVFTARLSQAAAGNVVFDIATRELDSGGHGARAGSDYLAASRGGVVIPAGQTSASFAVKVLGDLRAEPDEVFAVSISNITGATAGNSQALGWILDDDANP